MGTVRRQLSVLVVTMLTVLVLPSAAAAQDGTFGTDEQVVEGQGPDPVTVTGVQVETFDGFERVTFEIVGDGLAGYRVFYDEDDPVIGQGGPPTVIAGAASLRVTLTNILFPPDAPPGVEPFLDDVAVPAGGVITEIVNGSWFEGDHEFVVGVVDELPFRVQRLQDPQRIVLDIASTPVGGVATGVGGTADANAPTAQAAGGLALLALALVGGGLLVRRRRS